MPWQITASHQECGQTKFNGASKSKDQDDGKLARKHASLNLARLLTCVPFHRAGFFVMLLLRSVAPLASSCSPGKFSPETKTSAISHHHNQKKRSSVLALRSAFELDTTDYATCPRVQNVFCPAGACHIKREDRAKEQGERARKFQDLDASNLSQDPCREDSAPAY